MDKHIYWLKASEIEEINKRLIQLAEALIYIVDFERCNYNQDDTVEYARKVIEEAERRGLIKEE